MIFKEEANSVYDERGRELARIETFRNRRRVKRTPACTLGEYFAILSWLMDRDEQVTAE